MNFKYERYLWLGTVESRSWEAHYGWNRGSASAVLHWLHQCQCCQKASTDQHWNTAVLRNSQHWWTLTHCSAEPKWYRAIPVFTGWGHHFQQIRKIYMLLLLRKFRWLVIKVHDYWRIRAIIWKYLTSLIIFFNNNQTLISKFLIYK